MIVAIDIDSTIADLTTAWLDCYNRDYGDALTNANLTGWNIHEIVKPECGNKIYDYLKDREFYNQVKPYPGALESINYFRDCGYRVIFVTSTPPEGAGCKLLWLRAHGFLPEGYTAPDYYECYDKSLIKADILIDDGFHNVGKFPGLAILFSQPWNKQETWAFRVNDWEAVRLFERAIPSILEKKEKHPTEIRRPQQVAMFREIIERMYQVHLDKNADYSPANIQGTGFVGLVTRLWDKTARLMNLAGFRMEVSKSEYENPANPKNESIEDTLMDLAVYAIIGMILRQGRWGK